jgi:hypothetical protein
MDKKILANTLKRIRRQLGGVLDGSLGDDLGLGPGAVSENFSGLLSESDVIVVMSSLFSVMVIFMVVI